jgi:diaminopimelate epimerase
LETAFYKFHGTGNDFILIDDRKLKFTVNKDFIAHLCHRHFGIGADGLILLREEDGYDFRMIYFNSDGNESTMCGNGGRCIIAFADFLSLIGDQARFMATDGEHSGVILDRQPGKWHVRLKMSDVNDYELAGDDYFINTGSPHLVKFTEDVEELDIISHGRKTRYSPEFSPGGTNADFVKQSAGGLFVRTYERGVEDETMSCGTGVTASALAYAIRTGSQGGTIDVITPGGKLAVTFQRKGRGFSGIFLEGPAELAFKGVISTG